MSLLNIIPGLAFKPGKNTVQDNGFISYTVPSNATRSSAAIFDSQGNKVRDLWGNKTEQPNATMKDQWDGLDDFGNQLPIGTYKPRIRFNNINAIVEGFVGNTSSQQGSSDIFHSYAGITAMACANDKVFYSHFFWEYGINSRFFNNSDVTVTHDINVGVGAITIDCATDGNIVVWACVDQYDNDGIDGHQTMYIYATKVSDNTPVSFTNETTQLTASGRYYNHFIGYFSGPNAYTGIAINNNFIFATKDSGNLLVFDKLTGSIIQNLSYNNLGKLAAGNNNELWMVVDGIAKKFTVNSDGTLTDRSLSLPVGMPRGIRISPDNSTVLVADASTHQVKAYSNINGTQLWVLGQQGGFDTNGAAVTNDKFMFDRVYLSDAFVAYQADGSFWVNDIGNYRSLHFNADRTYKEQVMYLPSCRSVNIDPGTGNYFADELEFLIDHSKPLDNGVNGSWTLINNWKVGTALDSFGKFIFVITLSNGHKYGGSGSRLYDLLPTGAVDIGLYPVFDSQVPGHMEADGSFIFRLNNNNQFFQILKAPLVSFTTLPSGAQVPVWGKTVIIATTPNTNVSGDYPIWYGDNTIGSCTNPDRYFFFNPNQNNFGFGRSDFNAHLGSMKTGGNTFEWLGARGTYQEYVGDYPRNGDMDTSDISGHSENCAVLVNHEFLIWNNNGEFYHAYADIGGGEININNLVYEDGLPLLTFGKTGLEAKLTGNIGFAGNAFKTAVIRKDGILYYIECDESQHGAITCWKISGLDTISEQNLTLKITAPITVINDPTDLSLGLPYRSGTFTGGNGFSVVYPTGLVLKTNTLQYKKEHTDIALGGSNVQFQILKSLNNNIVLSKWKFTANISYYSSEYSFGNSSDGSNNALYFEILDNNNKVIGRFIGNQADTLDNYYPRIWFNNTIVAEGDVVTNLTNYFFKNITFTYSNNILTLKHEEYPAVTVTTPFQTGANMGAPANLRLTNIGNRNRVLNMYGERFTPSSTN